MIHPYNEEYLEKARNNLGNMFDYLVNDASIDLKTVWNKFINSDISLQLYKGNCTYLVGKSGCELGRELFNVDNQYSFKIDKSKEYWLGWAISYYVYEKNIPYSKLDIDIEEILELYSIYHEMDIRQFADRLDKIRKNYISNLKKIRLEANLSQSELSSLSNIPLRTIQQYEQKQKDINKASVESIVSLSKALYCNIEDLLE